LICSVDMQPSGRISGAWMPSSWCAWASDRHWVPVVMPMIASGWLRFADSIAGVLSGAVADWPISGTSAALSPMLTATSLASSAAVIATPFSG
jgi:hypothetical protein